MRETNPAGRLGRSLRRDYDLCLMIVPLVLYYVVFYLWPLYGIQIAFRDYIPSRGFTGSPFVGLRNFREFFSLNTAWPLIRNTLRISLFTLVVTFPVPIVLALMFNSIVSKRFRNVVQTIVYVPNFVTVVVVVGMLGVFLNGQVGVFNQVRAAVGLPKVDFMNDAGSFLPVYIVSGLWSSVGWNSIVYTGALTGIPTELYEAARIDGTTKLQCIRFIEVPAIVPTVSIMFILSVGRLMGVGWEKIYLMQAPLNLSVSEIISTYTYKTGILSGQFSYSAAIGLFNSMVDLLLLLTANRISRRLSDTGIW